MTTQNKEFDATALKLGDEIKGIVICDNLKCVTRNEPMPSRFTVVSTEPLRVRCCYCDHELEGENIRVK